MTSIANTDYYFPGAITGIAFGALMMTLFGCVWLVWGLVEMPISSLWWKLAVPLVGAALLVPCLVMFRLGLKAGRKAGPPNPAQKRESGRMGRTFGIVFAAEFVLIFTAVNVLQHFHLEQYYISAIAIIVGLHFLPLGRLYQYRPYYLVGTLMALLGLLSLGISFPVRDTGLGLSVGIILWLTCIALIRRGFQLAREVPAL